MLQPQNTGELDHLYKQTWPAVTPAGQVHLEPSSPSPGTSFSLADVQFTNVRTSGSAHWSEASQELTFGAGALGVFSADFYCSASPFDYEGVAFDVERLASASTKSQLLVELNGTHYMVLDGDFSLTGPYRVSFNAGSRFYRLTFRSQGPGSNTGTWIIIENFGCIELVD